MPNNEIEQLYESLKRKHSIKRRPRCASNTRSTSEKSFYFRCTWSKCSYHIGIWKDTLFDSVQSGHLLMLKILNLRGIGVPRILITHTLGHGKETVYRTLEMLQQRVVYSKHLNSFKQLGVSDVTVDTGESKFG